MKKRALILLLTLGLVASLLSACGNGGSKENQNKSENTSKATPTADSESETGTNKFADRDPVTLEVLMFGDSTTEQSKAVSEALSKITREKINADVNITFVNFGSYTTQLNLMLSSGQQLDVFSPFTLGAGTFANSGQTLPLDDLLKEYGKDTLSAISEEDWACASVNGKIYGVPSNKDKAYSLGFQMRKDILDELGIDVADIKSFDDLHDVLAKVKEAHPDVYPVISNGGGTFTYLAVDNLGTNATGVLLDPWGSDSLKVEDLISSDYFKNLTTMMYKWAKEGLIMPDASANTEGTSTLIGSGKGFGFFTHLTKSESGYDAEASQSLGTKLVNWVYKQPISTTSAVGLVWSIPTTSVDPERAMALLDLMYNDPEVSNLCINGVEGLHYQMIDKDKGIIDYPEGKDISTIGYNRIAWGWPNEQISYIWKGSSETLWSDLKSFNAGAAQSPAKGFSFDSTNVLNEVTACNNVNGKYYNALLGGQLDPEVTLPKYEKELKDNGLDTIMAEKQKQLDAWAAAKSK